MAAPRVVAKGADLLALKIRDLARPTHKVPVLQAPPLARALYAHTEVDQEIPARCSAPWRRCWPGSTSCDASPWPPAAAACRRRMPEVPPELDPQTSGPVPPGAHE
jgi:flagellar biosynthetic protein FlhB